MTEQQRSEVRAALVAVFPTVAACIPFALILGQQATAKGLSPLEMLAMSSIVFAGSSQLIAVGLWSQPAPIAALALMALLVNLRHVLMGASLAPKLQGFRRWQKFLGLYYMADENWALAEKRARTHRLTPAYWFAMVIPFVAGWLINSTLGAMIGAVLGDPKRLGADFAFTALFIALVAAFWKGRVTFWTVAAAGIASAVTYRLAGPPWHVAAGALCGLLAAWLAAGAEERPVTKEAKA